MEEAIEDFLEINGVSLDDVEDIDMSELDDGIIKIEGDDSSVAEDIEDALEEEDFQFDGEVIDLEAENEEELDDRSLLVELDTDLVGMDETKV